MNKKRIITTVVMTIVLTMLLAFGVSAETETTAHWINNGNGTWSYMDENGELVKGELGYWIDGDCYGFDANGIMYTGWVQPYKYDVEYIDSGDYRNTWYYFDASGRAADHGLDEETGYLFYGDGELADNTYMQVLDSETQTWVWCVSDDAGIGTKLETAGWHLVGDKWYYLQEDEYGDQSLCTWGIYEIEGTKYYFQNALAANMFAWDSEQGVEIYVDAGGHVVYEGWILHEGNYYYLQNGQRLEGGVYTVDEKLYYFNWNGVMAANEYVNGGYYAGADGALLVDTWQQNEDGSWMYYQADGQRCYHGWYTIGENEYYFEEYCLKESGLLELNEYDDTLEDNVWTWYQFHAGGSHTAVADGWVWDGEDYWYFVDGEPVSDEVYTVSGKNYVFNNYYMVDEETVAQVYWEKVGGYVYVHVNADGTVNETTGWKLVEGSWFYGQSNGTLRTGWLYSDGTWYYMGPGMYKNSISRIGGRTYYFDSEGKSSDFCADGAQMTGANRVYYYEYGTPATGWRQIDGNWYYFDTSMYYSDYYGIGDAVYYFDENGIMQTGWIKDYNGYTRYADENGHLIDSGLQVIDGETYIFGYAGRLYQNQTRWVDDVQYLLDAEGKIVAKNTDEPGWIAHNGKWYYLDEDGYFYNYGQYTIGENQYYFDGYVMVEDEIYDGYYYAPGGAKVTGGWINKDGVWYYAQENSGGNLAYYGLRYIDETDDDTRNGDWYYFDNYQLQIGSVVYGSDILITDASGRVVALQPFNEGWNLVSVNGHGVYYYVENGELYEGWLGDYYIDPWSGMYSGVMSEIDGVPYYFQDNGLVAKNSWVYIELYDVWLYAQESGELYANEWAMIGGTWYYFEGVTMLEDGTYWVEDKLHAFAEGGAWLGEVSEQTEYLTDGWQVIDGETHYVQYGSPVTGGILNIDGVWYGFGYNGLVKNDFNDNGYYMDGNGVVVPYTGWQLIEGKWYYFGIQHTITTGWFKVGDVQYYGNYNGIATGYVSVYEDYVGRVLYYFDESGACQGKVTADGWYANGNTWYYIMDGQLADGLVTIDGVDYYFYGNGRMAANTVGFDEYTETVFLVGANGARITAEGWYMIEGIWMYVDAEGNLCTGIHIIGGTTYYFNFLNEYYYYY